MLRLRGDFLLRDGLLHGYEGLVVLAHDHEVVTIEFILCSNTIVLLNNYLCLLLWRIRIRVHHAFAHTMLLHPLLWWW